MRELFIKLNNANVERVLAEQAVRKAEEQLDEAKKELLEETFDSFRNTEDMRKLVWEHGVSKNFGMDWDDEDYDEAIKYIKSYIKEVYCYNVDHIEL